MLMVLFMSCKNGNFMSEREDTHLVQLDAIMEKYNAKREENDKSVITQGKTDMIVKDSIVIINHYPEQGPELITYFLQGSTADYQLKSDSLGKAEVLFIGRNLYVHSFKKRKTMLFAVRDDADLTVPQEIEGVKQYTGFGLGARKFEKNSLHDNVPFCLCKPNGTPSSDCNYGGNNGEQIAHGCASGNPDGSCEVSCSLVYFACCDTSTRPE